MYSYCLYGMNSPASGAKEVVQEEAGVEEEVEG